MEFKNVWRSQPFTAVSAIKLSKDSSSSYYNTYSYCCIWLSCKLGKGETQGNAGNPLCWHSYSLSCCPVSETILSVNFEVKPQLDFLLLNCSGNAPETRGTAFVVYGDIFDAKNACDHLSGFNVCNRYLVVLYYQSTKVK